MMEDLAMHILEILMNSIGAKAGRILLKIRESVKDNIIEIIVTDNGSGMSEEMVKTVADPFTTTRKTRKIGMGVAFMKGLTEQCGGTFGITSRPGEGTEVKASIVRDHIDAPPTGDLGQMMMYAIQADETIDFEMIYETDSDQFVFKSSEIREMLEGVSLLEPEILLWIKEYINEGIMRAKEGMR